MPMKTLAVCGGYELIEDGPRLLFVHRGTDAYAIALYVTGLVAFIVGANGIGQVAFAVSGRGHLVAGLILVLVASLAVWLFVFLWKAKKAKAERGLEPQNICLAIDLAHGALLDAGGRPFAALEGVSFRSVFQVASSSRALELCYSGGTRIVARGSPFTGSIAGFVAVLRQRGFRVL